MFRSHSLFFQETESDKSLDCFFTQLKNVTYNSFIVYIFTLLYISLSDSIYFIPCIFIK